LIAIDEQGFFPSLPLAPAALLEPPTPIMAFGAAPSLLARGLCADLGLETPPAPVGGRASTTMPGGGRLPKVVRGKLP